MSTLSPRPSRPKDRRGFEIAIICALPLEADAVEALFDHHWDDEDPSFDKVPGDPNAYSTGVIGRHNVVLSYMPGMGIANAASVASNCGKSFPGIRLALVVGICGVVPFKPDKDEIVLGDVIISDGIIQYDFGRQLPDHCARKDMLLDSLGRPNQEIRGVMAKLRSLRHRRQLSVKIAEYLVVLRQEPELRAEYPGVTEDRLFEASYRHPEDQKSCEQLGCNGKLVLRSRLKTAGIFPTPAVHFGLIASGDSVMKSGEDRDRIAAAEGVIAFEMEGAGVWDSSPCIVIKGACDYADSHKSKVWQRYAAAMAAACAKALLNFWVPSPPSDNSRSVHDDENDAPPNKRVRLHLPGGTSLARESRDRPVFLVPFPENTLFVGRDVVLTKLQSLLFEKNIRKIALVGLGGIGKTQIALHLAFWVKKTKPDYSVFWMPAFSMASFEQECVKLVKTLGIRWSEGDDAREVVRQHLSSGVSGKWFLIVDNADDMNLLRRSTHPGGGILDFLPSNAGGRILLTTRSKQVAVASAGNEVVKLPQMGLKEASGLLKKSLIDEGGPRHDELHDDETVTKLIEILTFLPLAIAQAAAYMNTYETSIAEYIRLFKDRDERSMMELLEQGHDDDTYYHSSQSAVATTWIVSFDRIRRSDPAAAHILSFMAFIEPRAIPRSILPVLETEQQTTHAIGILLGHGFLSQRGRDATFDMHSLVHLVTQRWNKKEGRIREMQQATLARVAEVFPTDDWKERVVWRHYLPHALRLLTSVGGIENEEVCKLGYWVGRCLRADGRVKEAVIRLKDVVAIRVKTLVEDHPSRLSSQHMLAAAYLGDGQTKKAIKMLEHVVTIQGKILAEDHLDRLTSQHNLARAYQDDGQIKKAIKLLEHVVAIREKTLAEEHLDRLSSQLVLAKIYQDDGQIKKGIKLLEHVVAIRKKTLAEDHPSRLVSEAWPRFCYNSQGQVSKGK
ncbi:hypothetical protein FOMA001_g19548 [Fusarium oxysporum f. sp. matthiolae]|nr:hypothetical protein FOMA001_g19548 [Fusarium oxysporum f. sp. matthiolae]